MGLLTNILGIKKQQKNLDSNKHNDSTAIQNNEELMMHMIYRDGESDAEYELENDDYKEVPPLQIEIADVEKLKKIKERIRCELKEAAEIVNSELN